MKFLPSKNKLVKFFKKIFLVSIAVRLFIFSWSPNPFPITNNHLFSNVSVVEKTMANQRIIQPQGIEKPKTATELFNLRGGILPGADGFTIPYPMNRNMNGKPKLPNHTFSIGASAGGSNNPGGGGGGNNPTFTGKKSIPSKGTSLPHQQVNHGWKAMYGNNSKKKKQTNQQTEEIKILRNERRWYTTQNHPIQRTLDTWTAARNKYYHSEEVFHTIPPQGFDSKQVSKMPVIKTPEEPDILIRKEYLRNTDILPTDKVVETRDLLISHIDNPKTIEQWGTLNPYRKKIIEGFYYYNEDTRIYVFATPINGDKTKLRIKTYMKLSPEQHDRLMATGNYQKQLRKGKN